MEEELETTENVAEVEKSLKSLEDGKVYTTEEVLFDYSGLLDMQVDFTAYLGVTEVSLGEILRMQRGSIVDLKKPAGESVEIYINERIIGKGRLWSMRKI